MTSKDDRSPDSGTTSARLEGITKQSRSTLRIPFSLEVTDAVDSEVESLGLLEFVTHDISVTGLKFDTDLPFQVEDRLRVALSFHPHQPDEESPESVKVAAKELPLQAQPDTLQMVQKIPLPTHPPERGIKQVEQVPADEAPPPELEQQEVVVLELAARVAHLTSGSVGLEFLDLSQEVEDQLKELLRPRFKINF